MNKAYLKEKVNRSDIESFKENLKVLLSKIDIHESEEHHKYPVSEFLKDTWYKERFEINTKGRTDFVIHNGKTTSDTVGVIIEVKSPSNINEMISEEKPNKKAMHELILYYLRERIDADQKEIKNLIVTNILEWYVFDETWFEKNIFRSKLKKEYETFKQSGKDTKFFFESIARPFLDQLTDPIPCTYFDFRQYEKTIKTDDKKDDNKLIALYKILSPTHLLKQAFANDSNSLDTKFYAELLHIIGLEETKEGSKKIIQRKTNIDPASLLENVIMKLEDKDSLRNIPILSPYGATGKERLFNVALELCITWINRILFIKLLEGQLVTYHKGDPSYLFLNTRVVFDFDELNNLFFQVLAERTEKRHKHLNDKFSKVPYLNSSLFDRTILERQTIEIAALDNRLELPVSSATVLKNDRGKKETGKMPTLLYLFEFLNAYDFSSDGGAEIQEENKNLINASVLGLIFEKINGYKDGSFFTPGFVTMYMCRETIRRAVIQKFNEVKNWSCKYFDELYNHITDKVEANVIINSLKICDPAVGSGHFLVSALNELIAIKSDLGILLDRQGKWLRDYHIEVVNDELIVTEDGNLLDYRPRVKESQRIQESLFHEKETIIEHCLFGVDINPNSVKICRLRLWIELLKNAYYTAESNFSELETLPNIDINIKCGNSLISRFGLDADLSKALKKSKWTIDAYRIAVQTYREAESKEQKRNMEQLIDDIKSNFRTEISDNDPKIKKLQKLNTDYYLKYQANQLFNAKLNKGQKKDKEDFEKEINKLDTEIKEIKSNKIFEDAFEWRFEFPEVLDSEGNFIGFDVILGNPPYGVELSKLEDSYFRNRYEVANYQIDTYVLFTELSVNLANTKSNICFIIPNAWLASIYDVKYRKYLIQNSLINFITTCPKITFEDAVVETCILALDKTSRLTSFPVYNLQNDKINEIVLSTVTQTESFSVNLYSSNKISTFLNKIRSECFSLEEKFDVVWGVKVYEKGKGTPPQTGDESKSRPFHSDTKESETHLPLIGGREILPFQIAWKGGYINYGPWIAAPRNADWFMNCDRIVVREVTAKGKIYAALISEETVFSNSVDGIRSKNKIKDELLALLGILNSKFASFYHINKSGNSQKDAFPKILLKDLRDFPIPHIFSEDKIIKLVSDIMDKGGSDNVSLKLDLGELNQVIYRLYGLTSEEIEMIEGKKATI